MASKNQSVNPKYTQLTTFDEYDTSNMVFSDVIESKVPSKNLTYRRINIGTKNPDGSVGELIVQTTDSLFSFGVSENKNPDTEKVDGYSFPLCLWNKDGATDEESHWTEVFESVVQRCQGHLVEHRKDIKSPTLKYDDLELSPLYWKKTEDGEQDRSIGPTLYPKLIVSKKNDTMSILTKFQDTNGNDLAYSDLIGKFNTNTSAIKIESIYIGGAKKISLQVKLYESEVELVGSSMKSLLKPKKKVTTASSIQNAMEDEDEDENEGSVKDEEEEEEEKPKKIIRKVIKKIIKKA
jgi:hypothetical protein